MWFLIRFFESYCFRLFDFFCLVFDFLDLVSWKLDMTIIYQSLMRSQLFFRWSLISIFFFALYSISMIECFRSKFDNDLNAKRFEQRHSILNVLTTLNYFDACFACNVRILQNSHENVLIIICWIANKFDEFWIW